MIGGSAGIGLETARRARAEGADVILTGRSRDRLEQAAAELGARSSAAFDANDLAALAAFFEGLAAPIDHVLITAGAPRYGRLLEMGADELRDALSGHVVLAIEVARHAAARMRPGGTLLLMSGTGGRRIGVGMGIASAVTASMPATAASSSSPTRTSERTYRMRSDIVPGGVFPDYELPDHESIPRRLGEVQGGDPMILTLARGHYCPKEHQQHLELAANHPKIAVAYTKVVTISTDAHHTLQEFRASVGAQWPFLSDPGRIVQKDLDIQEYTDPENDPMIPHTLVLKPGLVVHSVYNGYWFWGRPSFADLWHDLRAATREIRPDWDLSTPGLREAWDAGELSSFHGWDKRAAAAR